jgi:divalent metal cation (Fe/Co/Zn/Cd) transporter
VGQGIRHPLDRGRAAQLPAADWPGGAGQLAVSAHAQRLDALRGGVRLEAVSVCWMAIEAVVAFGAGVAARSVLLTAFGLDSAIELLSGVTLLWRLSAEARGAGMERIEVIERRATWISAVLLVVLCVYVLTTSIGGLLIRLEPGESWAGLGVAAAAVIVMPLLAWRKRVVNATIQSPALKADIAETITCAYLAAATLAGLALGAVAGWWWIQYVAALALLVFIGREAMEALEAAREGKGRCEDD